MKKSPKKFISFHRRRENIPLHWEWNVPNAISLSRLFLIPFQIYFLVNDLPLLAFIFYFISLISDYLDGVFARKLKERTAIGSFLDPFVDKMTLLATFITLIYMDIIPLWFGILVLGKDLMIGGGAFLLVYFRKRVPWTSLPVGKGTSVAQYVTILGFVLYHYYYFPKMVLNYFVLYTSFFTICTYFAYIFHYRKILHSYPSEVISLKEPEDAYSNRPRLYKRG